MNIGILWLDKIDYRTMLIWCNFRERGQNIFILIPAVKNVGSYFLMLFSLSFFLFLYFSLPMHLLLSLYILTFFSFYEFVLTFCLTIVIKIIKKKNKPSTYIILQFGDLWSIQKCQGHKHSLSEKKSMSLNF